MDQLDRLDGLLRGCARVRTGTAPSSSAASRDSGSATAPGCCRTSRSSTASPTSLAQAHPGARMDDVDLDALARQLGDEAAVDARALAALEKALRDSGYLTRGRRHPAPVAESDA